MRVTTESYLRWLIARDLEEVLDIDRRCFGEEAWTEQDFLQCLRSRAVIPFVADLGHVIAGYMVVELHRDGLDLVRLSVHPARRRQGIGTQLMAKLASKLSSHRRTWVRAAVPDHMLPMQLFLRNRGYRAESVDGDRYSMYLRIH